MKIEAKISQKEVAQARQTLKRYGADRLSKVKNVVKRTTLAVDRDAKLKVPVNEGALRASAYLNFDATGLVGTMGFNSKYAFFVENGRGPGGFPPLQLLARWAYLKRMVPSDDLNNPETKKVVFLIGRKIAREGVVAQPFLKPAFESNINGFYRQIVNELRALERRV